MSRLRSSDRFRPTWEETERDHRVAEVASLYMRGLTVNEVARRMGVGVSAVWCRLVEMGFETGPRGSYSHTDAGYRKGYSRYGQETTP